MHVGCQPQARQPDKVSMRNEWNIIVLCVCKMAQRTAGGSGWRRFCLTWGSCQKSSWLSTGRGGRGAIVARRARCIPDTTQVEGLVSRVENGERWVPLEPRGRDAYLGSQLQVGQRAVGVVERCGVDALGGGRSEPLDHVGDVVGLHVPARSTVVRGFGDPWTPSGTGGSRGGRQGCAGGCFSHGESGSAS